MTIWRPFVVDRPGCPHCEEPDCAGQCRTCANCDVAIEDPTGFSDYFCSKDCWDEYRAPFVVNPEAP